MMRNNLKTFDLLESELQGVNLIEASAGTGKTYTISGLFLRLILERHLSVNQILVVTFTVAATHELRERIRRNLLAAREAFLCGQSDDRFLDDLVKKHENRSDRVRELDQALRNFDEAAIFTIHGFCQRMLRENAFESSSLFDTELIIEQESLKQEIADDFWRTQFYQASPLFIQYAMDHNFGPDQFVRFLGNYPTFLRPRILPDLAVQAVVKEEEGFKQALEKVLRPWNECRSEVKNVLESSPSLNRSSYSLTIVARMIESMDEAAATGIVVPTLFEHFDKFTSASIRRGTKKNRQPATHRFFELAQVLKDASDGLCRVYEQQLLALKSYLFAYTTHELSKRKQHRNLFSFDDLLIKLHQALQGKAGSELADAIRRKYWAGLIDEFQDTDPVQYAIFTSIFKKENHMLFLIGDPKQAIYSFRGADVFAYLEATREVDTQYTLTENWRSDAGLLTAINTLFSRAPQAFVFPEIAYTQSVAGEQEVREVLTINDRPEPPFHLWYLGSERLNPELFTQRGRFIKKPEAQLLVAEAIGAEVVRLLTLGQEGKARIGIRPIQEGDMAILVRKNQEAHLMQQVLAELRIPSVLYSEANLFESHEALEMERILNGVAEPNNERLLRGALATDMIGVKGEELERVTENILAWEGWLNKFIRYHELWRTYNFIRMFRSLLLQEDVRGRLLSFPDGERRLTNVLHLSEVLHQEAVGRKLGITGLIKWLSDQRSEELPRLPEHQLRLESDEHAVKVVTVHKSKGLEYPIVFFPFPWHGSKVSKKSAGHFTFHDERGAITIDIGSPELEKNRIQAERELLAENVRLLYVALTRAQHCCYIVWGRVNEAGTSAMAFLMHHRGSLDSAGNLGAMDSSFQKLDDREMRESLRQCEREAEGSILLQDVPLNEKLTYATSSQPAEILWSRTFSGTIDRTWKVSSFSSLTASPEREPEPFYHIAGDLPDYDHVVVAEPLPEEEPTGIFAFPRGTKAGTFMHDLLEHLDFGENDASLVKSLVADRLRQYGFELSWRETIHHLVTKVLSVPLPGKASRFTLSSIPLKARISEMEFYFPLRPLSPETLSDMFVLAPQGGGIPGEFPHQMESLTFEPAKGFMKGFIDLVFQHEDAFYLVDWKSNYLGNKVEDYHQEALSRVMTGEYYVLQYHLYAVALHQYLHRRLPHYQYERQFGGIYYLFLRGIDPGKGAEFGVYHARPSGEFIEKLCDRLIDR